MTKRNYMCSGDNKTHFKTVVKYFYHFSMIILCVVSLIVILGSWKQVEIKLNITTIMLAVIGFLFAFAGINIYSIFNTNIDEEKERLKKIQNDYNEKLSFTQEQWRYSKELIKYYQTCQMIIDSREFNAQIYEWVFTCSKQIDDFTKYLDFLYKEEHEKQYVSFKRDLLDITRGMCIQFNSFNDKIIIIKKSQFFESITNSDKKTFISVFNDLIKKIKKFEQDLEKTNFPQNK